MSGDTESRIVVALIFGGRSSEHEISCVTAGAVLSALDRTKFAPLPIGITQEGRFVLQPDDPEVLRLNAKAMPQVSDNGPEVLWPESASSHVLRRVDAQGHVTPLAEVDVVFPLLHGPWGEDGTIQGLLELYGLPYVGDGVLASAVGMDKAFTKTVLAAAGIPVAASITVTRWRWEKEPDAVRADAQQFGLPVFVKPCRAGSSVGVSRVGSWDELDAAVALALSEDSKVLIEEAVSGREIECGVLAGRGHGEPRVSSAGEIVVTGHGFYDYEAKYLDETSTTITIPAALSDEQYAELRDLVARAFTAIDGSGLARVDCFLTDSGFVVNEVNTMPGFTPVSMFPLVWRDAGMTYPEIVTELIELARGA